MKSSGLREGIKLQYNWWFLFSLRSSGVIHGLRIFRCVLRTFTGKCISYIYWYVSRNESYACSALLYLWITAQLVLIIVSGKELSAESVNAWYEMTVYARVCMWCFSEHRSTDNWSLIWHDKTPDFMQDCERFVMNRSNTETESALFLLVGSLHWKSC